MQTSETLSELFKALSKAQGEMPAAPKDAKNDHLRNTYATLGSVIATAQPVLARNGLGFVQMAGTDEPGFMSLTTRIFHESGEWIEQTMRAAVPASKLSEIQAAGSVLSYMRRYGLASALGIATEDDDGSVTAQKAPVNRQQAQTRSEVQPQVQQAPKAGLSAEAAERLTAQLDVLLAKTIYHTRHQQFVAEILNRTVEDFTELTSAEATRVYNAAKQAEQDQAAA